MTKKPAPYKPQPTSKAAQTEWSRLAKEFPQTHPQTLDEMTEYANTYGSQPDSQDTAPWMYQQSVPTPADWHAPLAVSVGRYYDPDAGEIYPYGIPKSNPYDPSQMDPPPKMYGTFPGLQS